MNNLWPIALTFVVLLLPGCACLHCVNSRDGGTVTGPRGADELPTYVYFIHPTRDGFVESPTEVESARVGEHFQYLKALTDQGVVLLAGPSTDPPFTGIVVFRASDKAAAQAIMEGDPAVQAGVFKARLSPFVLSLVGELR